MSRRIKNKKNKSVYTEEFKKDALYEYETNTKNIKETAKSLNINYKTFYSWVKVSGIVKEYNDPSLSDLERENLKLSIEIANLKMENEILKKGSAILRRMKS